MKTILSLFLVLLFVTGCGGGDGSETSGTRETENFNPTTIPTAGGGEDVCTENRSLPRGNHPIEDTTTITTSEGTLTLYSDGTYCIKFSDGLSHCDDWVSTPSGCLCLAVYTSVVCTTSAGNCQSCFTGSGIPEDDEVLEQLLESTSEILE